MRSAKAYINLFLTLPKAVYSHIVCMCWLSISVERNTGKWTVGGEHWEDEMQRWQKFVLITGYSVEQKWKINLTTADNLLAGYNYVVFRRQHPDEATMNEVLQELQNSNISASQLKEFGTDHC
jgi:hypothetical protein